MPHTVNFFVRISIRDTLHLSLVIASTAAAKPYG